MPAVNGVGKPCAGEPHARIDGRELETGHGSGHGGGEERPTGNRTVTAAPRLPPILVTAPAPDPPSDVLGVLLSASGEGCGDTETPWRWDENPWRANDLGQSGPDGGGPQAGGEGRTDLSSRLLRLPTVPVGSGRGGGMPAAVLEERLGDRFGYPEVLGCFVTLLFSLIVMVRTVLLGWVGAGYAGLFGVRCARGLL